MVSYSISCSSDTPDSSNHVFAASESPFNVAFLEPFTEYTCCIYAVTSKGNSPSVCDTKPTLEDSKRNLVMCTRAIHHLCPYIHACPAPGDAPNVTAASISSKTIVVRWKPPLIPNGVLTGYRVYVTYHNGSERDIRDVSTQNTSYYVQNLSPHQLITIAMSARTQIGEGPLSPQVSVRTSEGTFPCPVRR